MAGTRETNLQKEPYTHLCKTNNKACSWGLREAEKLAPEQVYRNRQPGGQGKDARGQGWPGSSCLLGSKQNQAWSSEGHDVHLGEVNHPVYLSR